MPVAGSHLFKSLGPATIALCLALPPASARELRVCADPNNLPFSNAQMEGFENKIVDLIARDLDATVTYTWWAQRRGFARNTLKAMKCDLWPGVATDVNMLATTKPYYRSTYVFVTRAGSPSIRSFDNNRLRTLKIGVQMIGDNAINTPPAHALAQRGIIDNVRGFTVYGDYSKPNPPAAIIDAVANGEIDVAVAWGPLAGYFAATETPPLEIAAVQRTDPEAWPMAFDISMATRKDDGEFRNEIDNALQNERPAINAILDDYHIPRALPDSSPR